MARTLDVYLRRILVGHYAQDDHGDISFRYADAWLGAKGRFPLSRSLPLRAEPFNARECRAFFSGVLPEAHSRELIARNLGISARNDFSMLERIGGECAGAVIFMPSGEMLPEPDERYREISESEIAAILMELPTRPLMAGDADLRLSLAGAQDKLPVRIDGSRVFLPLAEAPSTHILKPAGGSFDGLVYNEAFCMKLAKRVGLNVADVKIGTADGLDYLVVERYDRAASGDGRPERLHQEDFCQALGIGSENKYQSEGGPSLDACFGLLREASTATAADIPALLDAVVFNFLVGNNDAHGKNFSLLYRQNETRLAPLYDIVSTLAYPDLSPKMAMKIGGEYLPNKVTLAHFERLADDAGLSRAMVKRRIRALAEKTLAEIAKMETKREIEARVARQVALQAERLGR